MSTTPEGSTEKAEISGRTHQRRPMLRLAPLVIAAVIALAACTDDADTAANDGTIDAGDTSVPAQTNDDGLNATTLVDDSTTSTPTTGEPTTSTTESTSTTTESTTTLGPGQTVPDEELPGTTIDLFVDDGDVLAVAGVADDDVLNMRAKPGTDQPVLVALSPTADDLVATGRARQLTSSIWFEVAVDDRFGWVSSAFVVYLGLVDDATAEYLDEVGEAPTAETMTALGELVAQSFASEDPPSDVVQTVAPSVGDLGEVTVDVMGLGDDAVRGFRLHIFAVEAEGGDGFTLRTIERTTLCTRGLAGELCT